MTETERWKYFTTRHHAEYILSLELLGPSDWPPEKQLACLYAVSRHTERHYSAFEIPKRDGSRREILSPDPLLKKMQRNILRRVLAEQPVSPYATAYCGGGGTVPNASPHRRQARVLKLDLRDFFGSISYVMVYRLAFPRRYYPPSVAALLAHLCCCRDYLPQGAPTSPAISNLVMRPFDDYMGEWCRSRGVAYTRYCDDLTFSGDFDAGEVRRKAGSFLLSMGFEVNGRKSRLLPAGQRQIVTGLVVNEKIQTPREYRDWLRQEIYYCEKYGPADHLARTGGVPPEPAQVEAYLRSLLGRVGYVLQVDPQNQRFQDARSRMLHLLEASQAR